MKQQTASMEDYLEAIAVLARREKVARVTEISKMLGVRKPSVTSALKKLSREGLVRHESYGYVELTAEGNEIAQEVNTRHETLRTFLIDILGVDPEVAGEDACKIEHTLSPMTFSRLAKFVEFVLNCPRGEPEWLKGFNYYFEYGRRDEELLAKCQTES